MSSTLPSARDGALAKLAAEAARFAAPPPAAPAGPTTPRPVATLPNAHPAGYVPVAVAPERGNTRPAVPVDGRLNMRVARATLDGLDRVVREWRGADPDGLRDLERATLVRIGMALVLADIERNGPGGAVGEAVRAALDPAVRHTTSAMPPLERWIRRAEEPATESGRGSHGGGSAASAASAEPQSG